MMRALLGCFSSFYILRPNVTLRQFWTKSCCLDPLRFIFSLTAPPTFHLENKKRHDSKKVTSRIVFCNFWSWLSGDFCFPKMCPYLYFCCGDVLLRSVTIPDRVRWVGGGPFTYFPSYVRS